MKPGIRYEHRTPMVIVGRRPAAEGHFDSHLAGDIKRQFRCFRGQRNRDFWVPLLVLTTFLIPLSSLTIQRGVVTLRSSHTFPG